MDNTEMSIYDICKLSQDIQWASNPFAVVNELQGMMKSLSKHGMGSDEVIRHPAIVCMLDKLNSLAGIQHSQERVFGSYDHCIRVIKGWDTE